MRQTTEVAIGRVLVSKLNPRQPKLKDPDIQELSKSIAQHGILQPPVVRILMNGAGKPNLTGNGLDMYEICYGARRRMAAEAAGMSEIEVEIQEITDEDFAERMAIENTQRKDLTLWEESKELADLVKRKGNTQQKVAAALGLPASHVAKAVAVQKGLSPTFKKFVENEMARLRWTLDHLAAVARHPTYIQDEYLSDCQDQVWDSKTGGLAEKTVEELQSEILEHYSLPLAGMLWDVNDGTICGTKVGSCMDCPKRSGAAPDLFGDLVSGKGKKKHLDDVCLDPTCYQTKMSAHLNKVLDDVTTESEFQGPLPFTCKDKMQDTQFSEWIKAQGQDNVRDWFISAAALTERAKSNPEAFPLVDLNDGKIVYRVLNPGMAAGSKACLFAQKFTQPKKVEANQKAEAKAEKDKADGKPAAKAKGSTVTKDGKVDTSASTIEQRVALLVSRRWVVVGQAVIGRLRSGQDRDFQRADLVARYGDNFQALAGVFGLLEAETYASRKQWDQLETAVDTNKYPPSQMYHARGLADSLGTVELWDKWFGQIMSILSQRLKPQLDPKEIRTKGLVELAGISRLFDIALSDIYAEVAHEMKPAASWIKLYGKEKIEKLESVEETKCDRKITDHGGKLL